MNAVENPLIRLLPAVYQRSVLQETGETGGASRPALLLWLDAMTELQRPSLEVLDQLASYFDCYQAPDAFVPLLAAWFDLDWLAGASPTQGRAAEQAALAPLDTDRLRDLVAAAPRLARLRGTAQGLLDFMTIATGVGGFALHEPRDDGFRLRLWVPPEAERFRGQLAVMLRELKPAYTRAELFPRLSLSGTASLSTEVEHSAERPRRIQLRMQDKIDDLEEATPSGKLERVEPAGGGAAVWVKTFPEWQNS